MIYPYIPNPTQYLTTTLLTLNKQQIRQKLYLMVC